ncbi:TetR/AcrR family transcriptional regulator [Devosia sp.]|uniref:TetR/AcrR family transcriptional regulator n=1 Tax=Devosia sp. TaxID=1871048 RepID=UPI002FCB1B6D
MSQSKPGNTYHHGDLRRALVEAAMAEVERGGIETLSLSAIAKALGVSQPAPYRHFADRDALLTEVVTEGFTLFAATLKAAPKRATGHQALSRMAQAYLRFGLDHPGLYKAMFASHILPQARDGVALQATASGSFALLVDATGLTDQQRAQRVALRIWASLHGIVMLQNQGLLHDRLVPIKLEQLVEDVLPAEEAGPGSH